MVDLCHIIRQPPQSVERVRPTCTKPPGNKQHDHQPWKPASPGTMVSIGPTAALVLPLTPCPGSPETMVSIGPTAAVLLPLTFCTSPLNLQLCCSNHGFYGAWRRLAAEAAAYQYQVMQNVCSRVVQQNLQTMCTTKAFTQQCRLPLEQH